MTCLILRNLHPSEHNRLVTRKVTFEEDLPNDVFGCWFANHAAKDTKELPPQAPTDASLSSGDSSNKLKDCEELKKKPFLQDRPSAKKPSLLQEDTNLRPPINKLMNVMGGIDEVEINVDGPVFEDNILDENDVLHGFAVPRVGHSLPYLSPCPNGMESLTNTSIGSYELSRS